MQRVMIVGGPGSGKSTLARMLGACTGLPVHHMDHIHWQDGWIERDRPQKVALASRVEAQERWIFEGGLTATFPNRAKRADTLIWLDLPLGLRFWRVTKRTFRYLGQARPDLPAGCPERLNWDTVAFYRFIWNNRHVGRAKVQQVIVEHGEHLVLHHLRNAAQVRRFLATVPAAQG